MIIKKFLRLIQGKKEAQLEVLTDINHYNINNYINISFYNLLQGLASEAQLEVHSP